MDIASNRKLAKYSIKEKVARVLWGLASFAFRFSPRTFFSWRCFLLKCFGAKIGKHVHFYNSAKIYFPWNLSIGDWSAIGEDVFIYNLGSVVIGNRVTISQRAHLCAGTHDYTDTTMPLLKPPITIQDQVWVCADAFVGPGVTVSQGAVVAARAVVVKDVPPWTVVGGNPARLLKRRELRESPASK
jgi:putative colanic acid biosynthesis acetyltransferase WcaF